MRAEMEEAFAAQNETIAAAQTAIEESVAAVTEMSAVIEELQNTQATQSGEIATANARVDNLVANFTDNAEFDNSELIDIRVGYDGVTHESAGAAVRSLGKDLLTLT
jgi:chromosome segregation ATPase